MQRGYLPNFENEQPVFAAKGKATQSLLYKKVSPNPTTRIHKDHPLDQVIRDLQLATQTRKMSKNLEEHGKNQKAYLTSSRPDIMFAVCACARYQVNPKFSHLYALKMIFRYLKGQPKLGLWYPKDYPFDLVAYTDSDYAGASLDRKSTIGGCQFLGCRLISWQCKKQTVVANSTTEVEYVAASSCCRQVKTINGEVQLHALVDGKKIIITKASVRRDLHLADEEGVDCLPNSTIFEQLTLMGPKTTAWIEFSSTMASAIIYEAVHKELGDSLIRAATTASSLEVKQDSGKINETQSKATLNESSSQGTTSRGGPRCQETMRDTIAQARLKLDELMALCTTLQNQVLDLEKTKTTQHNEIASLKRKAKKLKKKDRSRTHRLKRLYKVGLTARVESSYNKESLGEDASKQGSIDAIDADEEITLVSVQNIDEEMFDVNVLDSEEVFVAEQEVAANKENNEVNVIEEVVEVINTAKSITDAAQVSAATTTIVTITIIDDITDVLSLYVRLLFVDLPSELDYCTGELSESVHTVVRTSNMSVSGRFCAVASYRSICTMSGKENGVNILKSIDEGPFQMGTFRETLTEIED
ncbi:hypothetical protein Tco_1505004 [Tanacetum coccineum]